MRPTSGVRYALERTSADEHEVIYEGFAHLPDQDVPLRFRVALAGGGVAFAALARDEAPHPRTPEFAKVATSLVRAATKAEVMASLPLPRKIVRWRG